MNKIPQIFSWSPTLTDHQSHTYSAIGKIENIDILCNLTKRSHNKRIAQGWKDSDVENVKRFYIPRLGFFFHALHTLLKNKEAIHIFASPFEDKRLIPVIILAVRLNFKVYLLAEPYSTVSDRYLDGDVNYGDHLKRYLRPVLYKLYFRCIGKRLRGIFAISKLAKAQFIASGVDKNKIIPFGYFVPKKTLNKQRYSIEDKKLRLIFVGSLIERKNIGYLIDTIIRANNLGVNVQLDVYGHGEAINYNFSENYLKYKGVIPFGNAQDIISDYDLLVLPSKFDGWGVVVNESILAGVPVVCSDKVGAGTLIEKFGAGKLFLLGDKQNLISLLGELVDDIDLRWEMRDACVQAGREISPQAAAMYFVAALKASISDTAIPKSPWYISND